MRSERRSSLRPALLGFALTFTALILLLTLQILLHYSHDFFRDDIPGYVQFKMTILFALSTVELALPISVLIMTVVFFRNAVKSGYSKINLKPTFIPGATVAILCFAWAGFITPSVNARAACLLYDIRDKAPDKPLKRTNLDFFINQPGTGNYSALNNTIDSLYIRAANKKIEFIEMARQYQLQGVMLKQYQDNANFEIESIANTINSYKVKTTQMISYGFLIFILFYTGMFIGLVNGNNRLWLLLLSLYLTFLPGLHYLSMLFSKLAKEQVVSPFTSQLIFVSILLMTTFVFYYFARKKINS